MGGLHKRKDGHPQRVQLVNTETCQPMELVCMDFLKLEQSKVCIKNILVVMAHFMKYAEAYSTRIQSAKTTPKMLFDKFLSTMASREDYIVTRAETLRAN